MNDLEKMRAGRWLHAVTPEIGAALLRAEELCFRLNQLPPSRREEREAIIRQLFGDVGEGAVIGAGSVVTRDIPPRVIAAGNPCRVLRSLTEADRIAASEID